LSINQNIKNKSDNENTSQNGKFLRCINIDCIFNSSNELGSVRNTCCHPNVIVESRFADITIAICSEFRSKKDYRFDKPNKIIELKTGASSEIAGKPEIEAQPIEKITTQDLEQDLSQSKSIKADTSEAQKPESSIVIPLIETEKVKPVVIETKPEIQPELTPDEIYNLTTRPGSDFLILKKLYQPYTKRGLIASIIIHLIMLFIMWQFLVTKNEKINSEHNQRIVIVEDLEMPKFDPPDIDKIKEEERKLAEEEVKDNTKDVRPQIQKRTITPNIKRPKDITEKTDTNLTSSNDTSKTLSDTTRVLTSRDTTRYVIPDSIRTQYSENDVGLNIAYPSGWKLIDNRQVNLTQEQFNGVILGIDSTSEDFRKVTMFVNIDDPKHSSFNKAVYKNPFEMNDSTIAAFTTNPTKLDGKKSQVKYYLFTDPAGIKNININAEFSDDAIREKYIPIVDAIVRSIKIAPPPKKEQ
jgi:hypothetical protein